MVVSGGNRGDVGGHNLYRQMRIGISAVAQLTFVVVAHAPQNAVALKKQAVIFAASHRRDVGAQNLLWPVGLAGGAIAQLAIVVQAHAPETAAALEKKA